MGTLSYSSNNSGGNWWLSDADWLAMEKAGWDVEWYKNAEYPFRGGAYEGGRWLGALASRATLETDEPDVAISEWEALTGQYAGDEGCNCCGEPHYFSFEGSDGTSKSLQIARNPSTYWS